MRKTITIRKGLIVGCALLLLIYLIVSRGLWFSDLEREVKASKSRLVKPIDVSRSQTITWTIKGDEWNYSGECHVALVLDRLADIPDEAYRKNSMALKVKMDASATMYEPTTNGFKITGSGVARLIRNWYFTTDTPLSPDAAIWQSWGKQIELGLCGLQRYPWEDTSVVVEITQPDPVLAKANPRLEIFGQYDYAVLEHIPLLRLIRDSILVLLAGCVIFLAYRSLKET